MNFTRATKIAPNLGGGGLSLIEIQTHSYAEPSSTALSVIRRCQRPQGV